MRQRQKREQEKLTKQQEFLKIWKANMIVNKMAELLKRHFLKKQKIERVKQRRINAGKMISRKVKSFLS